MKLNNKGFTFVEILAVIAIIGILSSIAIIGVSRYRENAKNKDYEALAKSSYNAMEEYMMANPYKKEVTLKTLDEGEFLSNRIDPATKNTNCEGSVIVKTTKTTGVMDDNTYTVYLCCTNYKKMYTYPDGEVKDIDDPTKCGITETGSDDYVIPEPLPGETTYNITYNLNGGTVTGNPDKYSKSMLPFTIKNPTRSGYTFSGWTGSNGTTPQTTVTLPKGSQEDKTYTANWIQNTTPTPGTKTYTLKYNDNGGTGCSSKSITKKEGVAWGTLCSPKKTGNTFMGWYTKSNGQGNKITNNSKATSNLTVYAYWKNNIYKITLDYQKNNPSKETGEKYTNDTLKEIYLKYNSKWCSKSTCSDTITKVAVPTRTNADNYKVDYKFMGYYTAPSGKGTKIIDKNGSITSNSKTALTSNTRVYAYWVRHGWRLDSKIEPLIKQKWEYWNEGTRIQSGIHEICSSNKNCSIKKKHYFVKGYAVCGWYKIGGYVYYFSCLDESNNNYLDLFGFYDRVYYFNKGYAYFDDEGHCHKGTYKGKNCTYCGGY